MQISCAVTAQLIIAFNFAKQIVQPLFFLDPKFQASIPLLRLYRAVFVGTPNCCFSCAHAHVKIIYVTSNLLICHLISVYLQKIKYSHHLGGFDKLLHPTKTVISLYRTVITLHRVVITLYRMIHFTHRKSAKMINFPYFPKKSQIICSTVLLF